VFCFAKSEDAEVFREKIRRGAATELTTPCDRHSACRSLPPDRLLVPSLTFTAFASGGCDLDKLQSAPI